MEQNSFHKRRILNKFVLTFKQYDVFIIVSANKFTQLDKFLATEVKKQQKHFYFVRTKIQQTLDSKRKGRRDKTINEEEEMNKILEEIESNLQEMYNKENCFIIDSYELKKFEFNKMIEKIYCDLPANTRSALAHVIQTGVQKFWK